MLSGTSIKRSVGLVPERVSVFIRWKLVNRVSPDEGMACRMSAEGVPYRVPELQIDTSIFL